MAGHSHWAGIKYKKGAADTKRGKLFSKLARHIMSAARRGGGDPDGNLALRYAIEEARAVSMPRDTIDRAIKKGTGELDDGASFQEITYEGYGPGGVAILCEALTDKPSRTAPDVRLIFDRNGGKLGAPGCVAWMFKTRGLITVAEDKADENTLTELALDAGALDLKLKEGVFEILTTFEDFQRVKEAVDAKKIPTQVAQITKLPDTTVALDEGPARRTLRLLEELDDYEDVQNVYANFDIPDDVLKAIGEA
jgi:YebC/PmpR family DNA-binding regulatory protein